MSSTGKRLALTALTATALLLFTLAGCSSDDSPNNPGGGGGDDTFDQTSAQLQAQTAAPQAVGTVESISQIANGVNKQGSYNWNATDMQWEYNYVYDVAGYSYDWLYTVQYLDAGGNPQQEATGASTVASTMTGTGSYDFSQGGYNYVYDMMYEYNTTISGLDTSTYTMTGDGGYDIDYSYTGQGVNQNASYVVNWETLDPGITVPASGGCPTGTIQYTFNPYVMDVVFNGTGTASVSMVDGSGGNVPLNPNTYAMTCVTK